MKITGYELFQVGPNWQFLKVETDEGIVGWGEPVIEGRAATVATAVKEAFDYLLGKDPLRIEEHWQALSRMQFYGGGPVAQSAVAGIDQALWDITGKAYGVPVHALLGGHVRERVRVYAQLQGVTRDELQEQVAFHLERGINTFKAGPNHGPSGFLGAPPEIQELVERVGLIREVVGPDRDFALDFHGKLSVAGARRLLPLLEEFMPLFAEEPVLPEYSFQLSSIVESTKIPIATGERLFSRWDFREVLESGIAIAQPDLSHAGGISEVRRIAAAAEVYNVAIAPHCPLGPIALAACLQIDFAIPNFFLQEQLIYSGYGRVTPFLDYVLDQSPFDIVDGHIERFTAPGLGVQIDEKAVRHAAENPHNWRIPMLTHRDGSHAIW